MKEHDHWLDILRSVLLSHWEEKAWTWCSSWCSLSDGDGWYCNDTIRLMSTPIGLLLVNKTQAYKCKKHKSTWEPKRLRKEFLINWKLRSGPGDSAFWCTWLAWITWSTWKHYSKNHLSTAEPQVVSSSNRFQSEEVLERDRQRHCEGDDKQVCRFKISSCLQMIFD